MTTEYLLATLAEECAETAKPACKAIRFGINNEYNGKTNLEEIIDEFHDIVASMELLAEHLNINLSLNKIKIENKKEKIKKNFKN